MSGEAAKPDDRLTHAYEHCAMVTHRRARNFFYGLRLTPEPKRSSIYAVYAWMRRADDEADAAGDPAEKRARLAEFRAVTERMLAGTMRIETADDPLWIAIEDTVRRHHIDPAHLRAMLDGLDEDLEHELLAARSTGGSPRLFCASRADLERYCYRVASTVGLVCITIWGLKDGVDAAEARSLAVQRGLAFQLTNILRDYAEDFDDRRVYLAEEDFIAAGISPTDLRRWSPPDRCNAMISAIAAWARARYEASAPLDRMIDPECYAALRTMTRIYSGLLDLIEQDPGRIVGSRRIRLPSARKIGIALRACARAWVNRHIPSTSPLYAVLTPAGRR